jgi:hypothetical protein
MFGEIVCFYQWIVFSGVTKLSIGHKIFIDHPLSVSATVVVFGLALESLSKSFIKLSPVSKAVPSVVLRLC